MHRTPNTNQGLRSRTSNAIILKFIDKAFRTLPHNFFFGGRTNYQVMSNLSSLLFKNKNANKVTKYHKFVLKVCPLRDPNRQEFEALGFFPPDLVGGAWNTVFPEPRALSSKYRRYKRVFMETRAKCTFQSFDERIISRHFLELKRHSSSSCISL